MKKKLVSLILALTFVAATLTACGDISVNVAETEAQSEAADTAVESDSPWMIGDPNDPIELTVFLNHTWYGTESFIGVIPEEITRLTGVTLIPTKATDYSQLGVMISSGEMPDLIFTSDMMDTLSDPAVSYAYDELIAEYCPDWEVSTENQVNAKAFSQDEHYYFVFSHTTSNKDWVNTRSVPMVENIEYRHDILLELGLEEPKTLDEFDAVCEAVKQNYPEMTPLVFATTTWTLDPFKTYNGCTKQTFVLNDDGTCDITAKTAPFYDYLKYCNHLYQNGYIHADNFSWESADAEAAMSSGKAFARVANTQETGAAEMAALKESGVENPEIWQMFPLSDNKLISSELGWCGTFITKNNSNPEASIRLMQFLFSEEGQKLSQWGREGIEYTLSESGLPVFSEEWQKSIDDNTNTDLYNTNFYFGGSKILEAESRCAVQPAYFQESNDAIREIYDNQEWYVYAAPKEADGDWKVLFDKLEDFVKTSQAKIILSETDDEFEANYAEFITNLDAMDVDSLAEFMAPRLAEAKKMYRPDGE